MPNFKDTDFYIPKQPLFTTENDVIYKETKTSLEKAWDKLCIEGMTLQTEEFKDIQIITKIYNTIMKSKVELETCLTTFNLQEQNFVEFVKTLNYSENIDENFKFLHKKTIEDSASILDTYLNLFKINVEKEKKIWNKYKDHGLVLENNEAAVEITNYHIFKIDEDGNIRHEENINIKDIFCEISYDEMKFSYLKEMDTSEKETILKLKNYLSIKKHLGTHESGNLVITLKEVENNDDEYDYSIKATNNMHLKPLFDFIISAFIENIAIEKIFSYVNTFLSRYFLKLFFKSKNWNITEFEEILLPGKKLEDQRSNLYFLKSKNDIVKVIRTSNSFDIYLNMHKIYIKNKNLER
ncbi:hypothetical protein EDEG_01460 [Edhazardia aedis USNM 41457]|uniref:Uncharacterized protein n=1 Tax=Edhazardia aedis (strain USNM 41457) TaxID=1003232 RepID=J8ZX55_EDHAE|nr:hypothetical protein EDEG_01460 [Edhazardia aedis USNM 41457]|eukprot:EJW04268.1 hypothetical protein EDEG_01460 [Edhazardia aedis USNM 41457]